MGSGPAARRYIPATNFPRPFAPRPCAPRVPAPLRPARPRAKHAPRNQNGIGVAPQAKQVEPEEAALLARLRAGEEAAFRQLVRARHQRLLRLAGAFCRTRASAEEVVQDTWLAVITGLHGYSGEAPLAAWINGILVNKAKTRAVRDGRMVNFSDLVREESEGDAFEPERFLPDGHWAEQHRPWDALTPEREASDRQLLAGVGEALEKLPPAQRAVVLLRDVEGLDSAAICATLGISDANLRVLLHRARTKLRDAADRLVRP